MQELKKMKNWICWKYRKDRKTGKLRKVPVAASGKPTGADEKHSGTWVTYEEAMREAGRCLRCDHYGCGVMEGGRGE